MPAVDAITLLTGAYEASGRLASDDADERPSAVISWPAVPIEVVHAAGLRPIVVRGGAASTPAADAHLESAPFPSRIRQLVEAALTGRSSRAACHVLPRTSDPDYKCFLYLRELGRRGLLRSSGPVVLFDLLQSTGGEVAAHNAARTRALFETLGAIGGGASIDRLHEQVAHANAARAALRRLIAFRDGSPRISGAEAMPLIGAFWQLAPQVYAPLALAAADSIARRPPLDGPRVLLLGAPVDGPALHAAIEAHGAVVVAETGPWGVGAAGDDVAPGDDPFVSIAGKYQHDSWGPRTSVAECRRWIAQALTNVDAAVVSLPPDDAVFGWDYPWLRDELRARQIPHLCFTHDPCQPMSCADDDRLATLVNRALPCMEARRG